MLVDNAVNTAVTMREVNCNAFITYIVNYHNLASVTKQKEYQPLKSVIMPEVQLFQNWITARNEFRSILEPTMISIHSPVIYS